MRSVEGPEEQARAMRGIKGGIIGLLIVLSARGIVNYVTGGLSNLDTYLGSEGSSAVSKLFDLGVAIAGILCAAVLIYCGIEYIRHPKKK